MLDEITPYPKQGIKNSELVRLCMKFPHDSFKYANEEKDENTTHLGVSYRRILPKLYSITHSLPSAYLIFPVKEDYEYFKKVQDFNMWDRGWLDLLVRTNRLKVSGSSDLFFLMELTNIPFNKKGNLIPGQMGNDQVTKPEFQHKVLSMFTSVWRSD